MIMSGEEANSENAVGGGTTDEVFIGRRAVIGRRSNPEAETSSHYCFAILIVFVYKFM